MRKISPSALITLFLIISLTKSALGCYEYCPYGYEYDYPICVTNGKCIKQLQNLCYLGIENCHAAQNCGNQWYEISCEYCDCPTDCGYLYCPVCACNGEYTQLFASECALEETKCITGEQWNIVDLDTCDLYNSNYGCPDFCSYIYEPVCAYNGYDYQTFSNICVLNQENCYSGNVWGFHSYGECPDCLVPYECK